MKAFTLLAALLICCTIASQTWDHPLFTMRIAENMRSPVNDETFSRQVGEYIHYSSAKFSPKDHPARVSFTVKTYELKQKQVLVAKKFVDDRLKRDSTAKIVDTFKTDNGLVVIEQFSMWRGFTPMGTAFARERTLWHIQGKYRVYEFDMFSEFDNKFHRDRLNEFRGYMRSFKEK